MDNIYEDVISFARQLSLSGCYSKAFDFYLMAFYKHPQLRGTNESEFRLLLDSLNETLVSTNRVQDVFNNFGRAMQLFPNNVYYINELGKYLYKFGLYTEAWSHFQKALSLDYSFVNVEKNLNSIKNLLVERWHFRMLNDKMRNEAYRAAIRKTIIPSKDIVMDMGTGSGLLALYATEASPLHTFACDGSEVMVRLAASVLEENNCNKVILINNMSTSLHHHDLGSQQTLVLTEMFDAGLFGEQVLQSLTHAWEHLISKDGRVIPNRAEFFVIGAKCEFLNKKYQLSAESKRLLKVPTMNVHAYVENETYDCEDVHLFGDDIEYMTEAESLVKVDFNNADELQDLLQRTEPFEVEFKALKDGEIDIIIGWFNLYLTDEITLTTDPRSKDRADAWQQAIFYDFLPKSVKENDTINVQFLMNSGKLTLVPEHGSDIIKINPSVIAYLNDAEYMKMILDCMGMACIYLGQLSEMSQISVIDLGQFPMFGLQLMKRGAQTFVCHVRTEEDKPFFEEVFKANDITLSQVTILIRDNWTQDMFRGEKYHAIFYNFIERCGEVDVDFVEIVDHFKSNHLVQGGLVLPASIKLMGQLVFSRWLEINNKLFDENVSNYKIAGYLNKYQATQNFCIDLTHLEYTAMSKPQFLGEYSNTLVTQIIHIPIIRNGQANVILCWYTIQLMENMDEISTNRKNSFADCIAFISHSRVQLSIGQVAPVVLCVDPDRAFKLVPSRGI